MKIKKFTRPALLLIWCVAIAAYIIISELVRIL